jgi:hypothetical protein
MTAPTPQYVMMMAEEEIQAIRHMIMSRHEPVTLEGQNGKKAVFRIVKNKLVATEQLPTGVNVRHVVMGNKQIEAMMKQSNVSKPDPRDIAKNAIKEKLTADKPDMTDEMKDYHADVIVEAQKTVINLIKAGVDPTIAPQMVTQALKMSDTDRQELHRMAVAKSQEAHTPTAE